ncbi:hypothetical protein [Tenacibaculum sp.]|uniref:hypothetical protein n=1 Tax=Tenacibaculum sp. TaxID=1906242 RepID=UPI003AA83681
MEIKPLKEFGYGESRITNLFITPAIMLVGGIALFVMFKSLILMPFIFGVVTLVIAIVSSNHKVLKFYEKHVEVQLTIVGRKRIIPYTNILEVMEGKGALFVGYKEETEIKRQVKINKKQLNKEVIIEVVRLLNAKKN